jgi:hypothetical protein
MFQMPVPKRGCARWLLAGALFIGTFQASAAAEEQNTPFDFRYVAEADGVFAVRPAEVLRQPGLKELYQQGISLLGPLLGKPNFHLPDALRPENIDQVVVGFKIKVKASKTPGNSSVFLGVSMVMVRLNIDFDGAALLRDCGVSLQEDRMLGQTYYRSSALPAPFAKGHLCLVMPDRRTLVLTLSGDEADDRRIVRSVRRPHERQSDPALAAIARAPLGLFYRDARGEFFNQFPDDPKEHFAIVGQRTGVIAFGLAIELGAGRPIRLVVETKNAAAADALAKAFDFDRAMLRVHNQEERMENLDASDRVCRRLACDLLHTGQLHVEGAQISWTGRSGVRLGELVAGYLATEPRSAGD